MSEASAVAPEPSAFVAAQEGAPGVLPDFRAVFDASPQPLLLIAADPPKFTMVAVNEAHARAFSTTRQALTGAGVFEAFGTDPPRPVAEFMEAVRASFEQVLASGRPDQMATRAYAVRQGEERYASATNAPVFGPDGVVTHIVTAVRDVTGEVLERRSEEARKLLMREVDHRARNALTVVQSFVRLTTAATLKDYRHELEGRVAALARAQTSLAARRWEGALLGEVVEAELAALAEASRYQVRGPRLMLPPQSVQAISMAVHELATNAAKYGALSTAGGRLDVGWSREAEGMMAFAWSERTEHVIVPPTRQGFGTHLVGQMARQLRGEVRYDWRPDGLRVELRLRPEA